MPMIFGPAGFVIMLGALIIGFLPKLISATKQLFGFGQQTEKDADAANKDLKDVESETGKLDGAETADAVSSEDIKPLEEKSEHVTTAPDPGSGQAPAKPVAMQGGGVVPGSGPTKTRACYAGTWRICDESRCCSTVWSRYSSRYECYGWWNQPPNDY